MAFRNYILLFALVTSSIAGPINVQDGDLKCAKTCEASLSDTAKFQYTPGHTYTYTYEGATETRLKGPSEQSTSLKIQATADIEVLSKCEFALKLREVSLKENGEMSSNSREFGQELQANPLRFAFQDGVIENVCSMSGEDERVLNIKRGVLATFQNSMKQLNKDGLFTETDVSGTCPTTYTSQSGIFGGVTITKRKDMLACEDRNGNISAIHSKRYNVPSKLQNAPLLKSLHNCVQEIKSGHIQKTVCEEVLMFRPFSKENSGAVTTASQTLTYSTSKSSVSVSESSVQRRSSMLFHHVYDNSIDGNAKAAVIELLQQICTNTADDIQANTPYLFGDLVSKMQRLDTDNMMQVYTAVNGGRVCTSSRGKKFFLDALQTVASEAAMTMAKKLITERVVQGVEAEVWLTQIAFIPRPSVAMLAALKPLLHDQDHAAKSLLSISAMVHKICDNNANCHSIPEVADVISILNSNIGSSCASTTKQEREIILVTLKALGNAGDAVTSSSVIGRCITNTDLDEETRVVALQAYRRMPCSVSREDAMRMYQNAEFDSELRIHAFLAIMSCPSTEVLTKVRMTLSGEPVNQVGSFVWTYLENLKETASPLKQELSSILDDAKLREDFNLDARKFSRNLEKSFFSDYLNAGAQIESNLIWSQRSYIPRSAMLNVTVEMFGNSINLVEFGGRVQGLERIVEKFFGPNGYFSKQNAKELMDNKRQTANHISSFDTLFKTPDDKITTSMYIKMFGNEIRFNELDSSEWTELQGFNILDFLIKLAEPKKIDITKNYQFLDSSLIVPTIVGLPMNLTVNGTASVSVDIDGNVDLRNIAASPRKFDINGHIKPSTAIVISGSMGVDAIVTRNTMKMVATMHSSTQLEGKITLQDGQIFNIELKTPQEKMEIFHVQTEFFMNGKEMTMPQPAKTYKRCTPSGMTKVIGMEMCVDVTLPTFHQTGLPLPPFTGPMNAQVFIEKKDTHTGYMFTAKYENDRQQVSGATFTKRVVHVSLDTPGSQVDRKLLLEGIFDPAEMSASAKLMSPWKKFDWSSSLTNTVAQKKALTTLVIDGTQTYSVDAQLDVVEKSVKTVWTPSLTITVPNKPEMSVSGTFETGTGKTVAAVDLAIKNFSRKPITIVSSLSQIKGGSSYDFAFNLKSDVFTSTVSSTVGIAPGNYFGRASLEYSTPNRPAHRFSASGKFVDESIGELMKYTVNAGVIPTEFPEYQFNIDADLQATRNHIDTSLTMGFNEEKLFFTHKTTQQGTLQAFTLETSSSFKYPVKNIDISGEVKHEHNPDLLKSSATFTYAGQSVSTSINLDKTIADKYSGEARLGYPGRDLALTATVDKMMDGEHKIIVNGQLADNADSKMSMISTWKSGDVHQVTSEINIPGHPVTLSISVKPELMDFMGRTHVTYNRQTYTVQTQYKLESTRFSSSGSWKCPHRDMSYDVNMSSADSKMTASSEISWEASKKVSMSGEYTNRDTASMFNRDAKVTVTSPYGVQSFSSSFEKTSDYSVRMSNEVSVDGVRSTMNGRYSMGNGGEFSLDTPYIRYGEVKAIEIEFNHDNTHVDGSLSWAPAKKISGNVKWSATKYSADFTTPFETSRVGASVELPSVGSPSAKGYWNNQEASITITYPDMAEGEFTIVYPGHTVSGSFSQSGDFNSFTGETEFRFDEKKLWTKVVFAGAGPVSLTIDVTTPFEQLKKLSANFNHEGSLMIFKNQAVLTCDEERIRTSLEFSGKAAKLSVKSPWSDDMLAQYKFTGEPESFTTNGLVSWASDKLMSADVTFTMTNDIKMTFAVKSPFSSDISGSMEHKGPLTDCDSKVTLTWAPSKTVTVNSVFSMTNGIKFQSSIAAPESMTVTIDMAHTGDMSAWTNSAEFKWKNMTPIKLYSQFSKQRALGKVGISGVPTEEFQQGEFSTEFTPATTGGRVVSTATWNMNKAITARGSFSSDNGYAMSASLTTPYTEDYSTEFTLTSTATNINNRIVVQWAPSKKITSALTVDTGSGLEVKMNANTPWRQIAFSASKMGKSDEFFANTVFSWETGKEISSTLEFSQIQDITLKWTLKTPFEVAREMSATLTGKGQPSSNFVSQLEAHYNGQEMKIGTTWDLRSGVDVKLLTTNPWKSFNTNVKFTGEAKDFSASADFTMDEVTYSTKAEFSYTDTVVMSFNVNPVIYKPVAFSARFGRETNTASLQWGDSNTISAEAILKNNEATNSVDAEISFNTPFEGYTSGEATFKHAGTWTSFRDTFEMRFNAKRVRIIGEFSMIGDVKGSVSLSSPWYNANGSFEHSGDLNRFSNSAEFTYTTGKTIKTSSKWNMADGIDAEVSFSSPFKTVDAKYNHRISASNELTAHTEMTMDSKQMFTSDVTFLNAPSNINVEFSFACPMKSFSGKYSHIGTMSTRCTASTEFTWDRTNTMTANWHVSMINGFSTDLTVSSPWKNFSGEIKHVGNLKNFENTISMACADTGKAISLTTEVTMSPDFYIKSSLLSPVKNANIMYRHSGTLDSFTCLLKGAYGDMPLIADLKWSMLSGYEASLDVESPWKNFMGKLKTNADWADLSSSAEFSWDTERIESSVTLNTRTGYSGTAEIKSPWRNVSASFDVEGEIKNFETKAEISWDADQSITAVASYNTRNGKVELSTPWRVLSANYRSMGPLENFDATMDFSWETGKKITLEAKADSRSGLDTTWRLITPERTFSAELKYDLSYNLNTNVSWETGKSISAEVTNVMTESTMDSAFKVNTPWRTVSGEYRRNGTWKKFDATTVFSWETGKSVKMETAFNILDTLSASTTITTPWRTVSGEFQCDGTWNKFEATTKVSWETGKSMQMVTEFNIVENISGSTKITTPWRDLSAKFEQTGDLEKFNGMYEVSWEATKKITSTVFFNRQNGWDSKFTVVTPWRTVETNAKFAGNMDQFRTSFDFSWEAGKIMSTAATFKMNPFAATWTWTCPNHKFEAEARHTGSLEDFNNFASFSWGTTEKIEVSSLFKNAAAISGQASIKSPFSSDFELSFEHTATRGDMTLTNPFTENVKAEYTYTDMYNFVGTFTYGTKAYTSEARSTWNNGLQTLVKVETPEWRSSIDVNHQGDFSTFANTVEATCNGKTYKLTSTSNLATMTFSQELETPYTGFERMSWSANFIWTESSAESKLMVSRNTDKIELDFNGDVEWKKYKSILNIVMKLKTPYAGFEDNQLSKTVEYSQRLINWRISGYKGSMSNRKSFEYYAMSTGAVGTPKSGLTTYLKYNLFSDEQSEITFDYTYDNGHLVSNYKSVMKSYPALTGEAKLDVTYSRNSSGMNCVGTLDYECHHTIQKIEWSAASTSNMCETGYAHTINGERVINYAHKTTWTTDYTKMDHDMTFKTTKCEVMKDCQFKVVYDFTHPTRKTIGITMFNDPTKPFDFKSESVVGDNMSFMNELSTPFDALKFSKTTVTINKAMQPWNVKVESTINEHTVTAEGSATYTGPGIFDVNMSFTSQIPKFESLSMSVSNTKLQDQWKPHMVVSWASDKKVELSATASWVSQYKASIDLSTPFDSLRSLVTDVTINNELPSKLSSSFEFQTNQMSEKLSSQLSVDMDVKSFSLTLQTPFQIVRNFEITSAMKPRLGMLIKLNNENMFTLSGNGRFESWKSHDLDVSVTYPFLNQYMRLKINNDLSWTSDNTINSYVDFEYMRGKELSFKFDFKSGTSSVVSVNLETPFERLEKTSYVVTYEGTPQSWSETTQTEFYYGKVNTRTTFSMTNGISYHQTINGQMKNGLEDFNLQKDLVFTGDGNEFSMQTSISGSFVPTIKFDTAWKYNPIVLSLKSTFNDYYVEYIHNGPITDFTCNWKVRVPAMSDSWFASETTEEWVGTWSFKNTHGYTLSADITCAHANRVQFTFDINTQSGNFNGEWKQGEDVVKYAASYKRSATPFKYEGALTVESSSYNFASSIALTENSIDYPISIDGKEVFAIRASIPKNADNEYTPTIDLVIDGTKYEFDGLFKNEGEGLVRDFKLHMNGPRGTSSSIKFEFEFRTQSFQLVPGDMKLYFSHLSEDRTETKLIDMNAAWGNDHALVTFVSPRPMRYKIDFSVSTSGLTGTIEANWDTREINENFKMDFVNKFASSSRSLTSEIDIDVIYTGISRGFTSTMDWQTGSFAHKLTLDYNGKEIGYDMTLSSAELSSLEIITEWRSVKGTWSNKDGIQQFGFYWDSARDLSKRFLGTSQWEVTGPNAYKWTSTFSHPALSQDVTIIDTLAYDNSRVYLAFNKKISYSRDTSKDIIFDSSFEKTGRWGVSLRQDFNNIKIIFGNEYKVDGINVYGGYKAFNGRHKSFALRTSHDSSTMATSVELITPMKTVKLEFSTTRTAHVLAATIDGKTYTTTVTVRPDDYFMQIKMSDGEADMQLQTEKLNGGYQVQLTKIEGSGTTIEGLAFLGMNESRTINGKLFWNPALISEIKGKISTLRTTLKDTIKSMSTAVTRESTRKLNSIQLGNDFDRIMPHTQTEVERLQSDLASAKVMIQRGYNQDVFFIKSINAASSAYVSKMLEEFSIVKAKVIEFYGVVIEPQLALIGEISDQTMLGLTYQLNKIEARILALQTAAATEWMEQTEELKKDLEAVNAWLQTYIDRISEYLAQHPVMESLRSIHSTVMTKFNALSDAAYSRVIFVANPQLYTDAIYSTHTYVNGAIRNSRLAAAMDVSALTGLSDSLMYKLKFYYDYYGVSDSMKMFLDSAKTVAAEYLNDYLIHYVDQTLNDFKWVAYDVAAGRIEFEFVIPTTLNNIDMMQIKSDLKQRLDLYLTHVSQYHISINDIYYMYNPRYFGKKILPPFDAQAIIAGQHIRTFDRRHYDFSSGKCSYLLARDFQDGNFTIYVNYNGDEQSLTVHSNGKIIDIQQDNTIKMDGSKTELPIQFFNTSITRMGPKIVLTSTLGVEVVCDNQNGLCTVEMSGHYFAKTGGLFGTYNYEPLDDFTTSANINETNVDNFANSWTSRCTGSNDAKTFLQVENSKEYKACTAMFHDSASPLRSCFSVVKTDQAFHKCITDMSLDVTSTFTNGPCKAAMFYRAECAFAGVDMEEPAQCVSCQVGNSYINRGASMQLTERVFATDVVFVIEEKMCNYQIENKLPQLAKLLETSLSFSGFKDIRFGLVGFGGDNVHSPSHIHTMDSKIFAAKEELSLGTSALQFSSVGTNKDVFDAIDFAAQYPFRAGASKVIIVIPCSDCSESKHSYRSILKRLDAQDISLHVIQDFPFEMIVSGKNPSTNYLFGIDNAAVYTVRDTRSVKGTTRLYPIVNKPVDDCSNLALQTGGTIFDLNMMTKARGTTIKSFQSVFAGRLALTTTPTKCNVCSCEYNNLFMTSRSVCRSC